jgi:ABC-2 type transport system ATP-binding protein
MHQVEELADRIALIDKGKTVLYGGLDGIRRQFSSDAVLVRSLQPLPATLPGVREITKHNSHTLLKLDAGKTPQQILQMLVEKNVTLEQFEIAMPTLDEIFIQVVQGEGAIE